MSKYQESDLLKCNASLHLQCGMDKSAVRVGIGSPFNLFGAEKRSLVWNRTHPGDAQEGLRQARPTAQTEEYARHLTCRWHRPKLLTVF